ncbi:PHP-associated domain-containing protein, partial [Kitasatospora sp. NPDC093558]|uniref:PHP-associated domain-containing protein n=1 Tax=Kitasatospora sp. NPDC093558 TaxID=3155201 RepID=UPI00342A1E11
VRRGGGLCVAAHPHAPYVSGTFRYPYRGFDAVEVWNGPWRSDLSWQADNEAALTEWGRSLAPDVRRGRWRPAVGNSDAHLAGQIGVPHTVVLADELGAGAVLAGIRAGRSRLAASDGVELAFSVTCGDRTAGIGEALVTDAAVATGEAAMTGDGPAVVRAEVRGVPFGTVVLHTGKGRAHTTSLPGDGAGTVEWPMRPAEAAESVLVRVEVRYADGRMAALTNSIVLH